MLQDFREGMKGIAFFIVILIIVPFAFVGIDSIFSNSPASDSELDIDGHTISRLDVNRALAIHKQRLIQQLGEVDPALLDDTALRGPVKQRLIREKAAELTALSANMGVSPVTIASLLQTVDAYQTDGKFDREKYEFAIRQMGYTSREHGGYISRGLLLSQFTSGLVDTGFVTDADLELTAKILEQRRSYYYLTVPIAPFIAASNIEDGEIKSYYENHREKFRTEEKVQMEYIRLTTDDLLDQVEVDDVVVRELFDARQKAAQLSQRQHVQHILIESQADGSHMAKITEIQKKLSNGEEFAALANEYSDDLGSAEQGGDLGFVEPGAFPAAFEEALNGLSVEGVSEPVETDSGIHLIRLVELERTDVLVFEDEKVAIEGELKQQLAAELLPEKIEQLRELSYNAESLADPALMMGLKVENTEAFSRHGGGQGLAAYPAIVSAAYEDDVLNNNYTSDVVELGDDRVVVLKLSQHFPAGYHSLEEASSEILSLLKHEDAKNLLMLKVTELKAQIEAGESIESVAKKGGLAWQVSLDTKRFDNEVDTVIRDQVFSLAANAALPAVTAFGHDDGDYVIVTLTVVEPGNLEKFSASQRINLVESAGRSLAQREYRGYESLILANASVKMDK